MTTKNKKTKAQGQVRSCISIEDTDAGEVIIRMRGPMLQGIGADLSAMFRATAEKHMAAEACDPPPPPKDSVADFQARIDAATSEEEAEELRKGLAAAVAKAAEERRVELARKIEQQLAYEVYAALERELRDLRIAAIRVGPSSRDALAQKLQERTEELITLAQSMEDEFVIRPL